jgi:hypothetical protein
MRIVLSLVILLGADSAGAAAVKVTEAGDTAYYVDSEAIGRTGSIQRVSVVHDYTKPEPGGVRSRRVAYEIDCGGDRLRSVSATEYAEPMAQGSVVNAWQRESDWLYVTPITGSSIAARTPYRSIVKFVCSR